MSSKQTRNEIDSEKILLIPQLVEGVATLQKLIVTGNLESGEPGLLESVREIRKDISDIKNKQLNLVEIEKRVTAIEKRHIEEDAEKQHIKEQKKRLEPYQIMVIGTLFSNIVMLILNFFGLGK